MANHNSIASTQSTVISTHHFGIYLSIIDCNSIFIMDTYTLRIQLISNKPNYTLMSIIVRNTALCAHGVRRVCVCAVCTAPHVHAKPTHVWYAMECALAHLSDYYYYHHRCMCIALCSAPRRLLFGIHWFTISFVYLYICSLSRNLFCSSIHSSCCEGYSVAYKTSCLHVCKNILKRKHTWQTSFRYLVSISLRIEADCQRTSQNMALRRIVDYMKLILRFYFIL